jgi:hypothetical protein
VASQNIPKCTRLYTAKNDRAFVYSLVTRLVQSASSVKPHAALERSGVIRNPQTSKWTPPILEDSRSPPGALQSTRVTLKPSRVHHGSSGALQRATYISKTARFLNFPFFSYRRSERLKKVRKGQIRSNLQGISKNHKEGTFLSKLSHKKFHKIILRAQNLYKIKILVKDQSTCS